jgi:hypothetical protein
MVNADFYALQMHPRYQLMHEGYSNYKEGDDIEVYAQGQT